MTNKHVSLDTLSLHPIGPTAFDVLTQQLTEITQRLVRLETRHGKLMLHMGMSVNKPRTY